MSGTPSPVMAEVGTNETVRARSSFFQYSSELSAFCVLRERVCVFYYGGGSELSALFSGRVEGGGSG